VLLFCYWVYADGQKGAGYCLHMNSPDMLVRYKNIRSCGKWQEGREPSGGESMKLQSDERKTDVSFSSQ